MTEAKTAKMFFRANVDYAGNQNYGFYTGKNGGSSPVTLPDGRTNTTFTLNGTAITLPTASYGALSGIEGTSSTINKESGAKLFEVAEVSLQAENNEFIVLCSDSYGLNYWDIMFIY